MSKFSDSVDKAKNKVKEASDKAAKDLKEAREEGEAKIDEAKTTADGKIEDSKLPDPVKKAAKNATEAGHKAAKDAVEKGKQKAKEAVEEAEKKAHEAIAEAEKKADEAIAEAEKIAKEEVEKASVKLKDVIDDSNLPGPLKDLAKKGVDELKKLADKGIEDLKKEASGMVDDLKKDADEMAEHLKDKALEVLGFEKKEPPKADDIKPKPPTPAAASNTSRKFDHQGVYRFKVQLGSIQAGAFTAVDGLTAEIETIEYQGGMDMYSRQIPGRPKVSPVVLKKGWINTALLWDWMRKTMEGELKFENISLTLVADDNTTELVQYDCLDAWPSRWNGFQLDAQSSNAMLEELELQVREVKRIKG